MGGSNETKLSGLRMHISGGETHVHDDARGFKFQMDSFLFKKEVKSAFEALEKSDGIVEIEGKGKENLCIMRSDSIFDVFVKNNTSIKTELQKFIRNC